MYIWWVCTRAARKENPNPNPQYRVSGNVIRVFILICATRSKSHVEKEFTEKVGIEPLRSRAKRTLANSLPGLFAPCPICSPELSLPGHFALWPFTPRNESSRELLVPGTFVFWNLRSQNVLASVVRTGSIVTDYFSQRVFEVLVARLSFIL